MNNYLQLLQQVYEQGDDRTDRTDTGTRSLFGTQLRFDLRHNFPLLTTKKMAFKAMVHELLWFLSGDSNIKTLQQNNVRIWDEWADANGDLGPVYGYQWRHWPSVDGPIDQIKKVVNDLKVNPYSRRHIVSAWNVAQLSQMRLPPCHMVFQFYVSSDKQLSCQLYQRSADLFLGVPFNIASYSLLTLMVAQVCGYQAKEFIWSAGDVHLYHNHFEQAKLQLGRAPLASPQIQLNPAISNIFDFRVEDITLINYQCHTEIKAPIAV